MNIQPYLDRIKFTEKVFPTLEVLSKLQQAHLLTVPFENLDIWHKIKIDLANSYTKIVLNRRGGFCYELNGLFFELLHQIGFKVKMISGRVFFKGKYGPEFDHLAIIATIEDTDYLVDVGFGEFAFAPLQVKLNTELQDQRGVFIIQEYDEKYYVVKKKNIAGEFIPDYLFTTIERTLNEFDNMCHFHQTSSESHFSKQLMCTLPVQGGRITLAGSILKITRNDVIEETPVVTEDAVKNTLHKYFGIIL